MPNVMFFEKQQISYVDMNSMQINLHLKSVEKI